MKLQGCASIKKSPAYLCAYQFTVRSLLFLSTPFFLICCSGKDPLKEMRWSRHEGVQQPTLKLDELHDLNFQVPQKIMTSKERIYFREQNYKGARVQGAYLKEVYNGKTQLDFLSAQYLDQFPESLEEDIQQLRKQQPDLIPKLLQKYPLLKNFRWNPTTEIVLIPRYGKTEAVYKIYGQDPAGVLWSYEVSKHLALMHYQKEGSSFSEAMAIVFPDSPLKSQLSEVILPNMATDGTLNSSRLALSSESSTLARSQNSVFKFPVNDTKFYQVQAFYFVLRTLDWFESHLRIRIPFRLNLITDVSFPKKANIMNYFQGTLRFGTGDGDIFANIPTDPSILGHEVGHALVDTLARLPYQSEGGSLNEAFSDFFVCAMTNNPKLGEVAYRKGPYKRAIDVSLKLSERNGGLYHDSLIVSGLLWHIKQALGQEKALNLAVKILTRLTPASDFADFDQILTQIAAIELDRNDQKVLSSILVDRGWNVSTETSL